jgi:hypothetical protein
VIVDSIACKPDGSLHVVRLYLVGGMVVSLQIGAHDPLYATGRIRGDLFEVGTGVWVDAAVTTIEGDSPHV